MSNALFLGPDSSIEFQGGGRGLYVLQDILSQDLIRISLGDIDYILGNSNEVYQLQIERVGEWYMLTDYSGDRLNLTPDEFAELQLILS